MAVSLVGRKLGLYSIVELIGQGGMATVYKGYREDIDRYVAIKVLPPHPGLDQQFIDRFRLEAKTIARLQHPHILPIYDYGAEDDILYLVMAFVDGGSLSQKIDKGPIPLKDIEALLRQMAAALDYAHRQGVVHRDIKPDNILLDKEGHALLADFGIVKLTEGDSRLTATGGLIGTPAYMAPEQGAGQTDISGSADIYSLGVVTYEMLTGRQPYTADTPVQIVIKHMTEPIPNPRTLVKDLPDGLETVIERALAKNPSTRYQTATAFVDDFASAVAGQTLAPRTLPSITESALNPTPTVVLNPTNTPPSVPGATQVANPATGTQPTIIVQQGTNPLVFLGGIALIALVMIGLVFVLVNRPPIPSPATLPATTPGLVDLPITPTAVPQVAEVPTFGRMSFSTTEHYGDTATLQVQNLRPPAADFRYVVWLKNMESDEAIKIGALTLDASGSGVLPPFIDEEGRLLPAFYNAVALTLEARDYDGQTPQGEIIYMYAFAERLIGTMTDLFISAKNGIEAESLRRSGGDYHNHMATVGGQQGPTVGLVESALAEAERAQQHAGLAQVAQVGENVGAMHRHNEHTINIYNGTQVDYNGDGSGENPGFQIGVTRLLDMMEQELNAAATAPDSDSRLQSNLETIRVCITNTRERIDRIIILEQEMLNSETVTDVAQQAIDSTGLANQVLSGLDANGNGQVEPFEGECGLEQIQTYGLLVATMTILETPATNE